MPQPVPLRYSRLHSPTPSLAHLPLPYVLPSRCNKVASTSCTRRGAGTAGNRRGTGELGPGPRARPPPAREGGRRGARGRSQALRSGFGDVALLHSHTRLEDTGSALPLPEKRGGAGRGGPASCGRGGACATRPAGTAPARLRPHSSSHAPQRQTRPLQGDKRLQALPVGTVIARLRPLTAMATPTKRQSRPRAVTTSSQLQPRALQARLGGCQLRHWQNCPCSDLHLLKRSHAPLITATPANSGKGGSCVALKAEAAYAWLLLFGGSLPSLRRQFRPRQHSWGL